MVWGKYANSSCLKSKQKNDPQEFCNMLPTYYLSNYGTVFGALGLFTGIKGLKETGSGLVQLGLASKIAAHFL